MKQVFHNRRVRAGIGFGVLAVVIVVAAFLLYQSFFSIENQFPMWSECVEITTENRADISLSKLEVEADKSTNILLTITNTAERLIFYEVSYSYSIEFFYNGKWHTVYEPEWDPLIVSFVELEPNQKTEKNIYAPPKTFAREGLYRIRVSNLGYCSFHVTFDESGAASWEEA